jgi:flagellar motor switch protein FliM
MKVREYDFRTANRFPKEQMRTFHVVFETFGQLFSNRLSSILRVSVECDILSLEECSYAEFNNSLPAPVILAVMGMPPMYGSVLVQMSPELASMLISRLFGGASSGGSSKQFTEIELALVERVLRQVSGVFDEAWDKVLKLTAQIERIETSPQFAQITAPNEPVAVVILSIVVGGETGLMSICIPHTAVEPVAQQLNTKMWFSSGARDDGRADERYAVLSGKVFNSLIPLTAYFTPTEATVHEIIKLQPGDVVQLDHAITKPLMIKVSHIPKVHATVGTMGAKYALQIVDIIKEESENESFAR